MKITVLNGSPKGDMSVTMQYVRYLQKILLQHDMEIVNIAQRIKRVERNEQVFEEIMDKVRASDGVLWAFPLYILHIHAHYKRFIELIWERGAESAFASKHTASLSTSIHYFDHTAHNYVQAICDDLRNVAGLPSPVGEVLEERTLENGLELSKVRVPIGVIAVIFESRPNVTFDVTALCLRSRNACVLKGSSDARDSNAAIVKVIHEVLEEFGLDAALRGFRLWCALHQLHGIHETDLEFGLRGLRVQGKRRHKQHDDEDRVGSLHGKSPE